MRLTLRTLLAYLDDVLEPAQAKELGEKIAETAFASSLVGRIREVMRRRRISAPDVSGPGSAPDPNLVSEYLDNTLAPEGVADVERVCLESDSHLAEVAACHKILTLVLGKPVEVSQATRQRMYALGAGAPPTDSNGQGTASGDVHVSGIETGMGATATKSSADVADRLPEALRRKPGRTKKVLAYAAGGLVLVVWVGLIASDPLFHWAGDDSGRSDQITISGEAEKPLPPRPGDGPDVAAAAPSEDASEPTVVPLAPDATTLAETRAPQLPTDVTPAPAADSEPRPLPTPAEAATTPSGEPEPVRAASEGEGAEELATRSAVTPDPEAFESPDEAADVAPPLPEPLAVLYASTEGVLLQRQPGEPQWTIMPRRALIYPHEEVACPQPFDAKLMVGDSGIEVHLRGGARVTSLGATEDGRFGFSVDRGRLVIHVNKPAAAQTEPFRLSVRGDAWKVEPLEADTICGIEVKPLQPTGEGDLSGAERYGGGVFVVAGTARVTSVDGQTVHELGPGKEELAFSADPLAAWAPEALLAMPEWTRHDFSPSAVYRRYAIMYEKEFIVDQPAPVSIVPVVKHRVPKISEFAVKTLAVIDEYAGMIDGLQSEHEETRLAAIAGLREWLPRDPDNGARLKDALHNEYREDDAEILYRLLWGFDEQDARNEFASQELVEWLDHPEIAVRELAFFYVHRLTDHQRGYRPDTPAREREAAVNRWRDHLDSEHTLLGD